MKRKSEAAQQLHQRRQAFDVLAVNLDQLQPVGRLAIGVDAGMRGLDQRRFAHAARAPQQRVVGGQAIGEALGVLDQDVAHPVDALEQAEIDAADARHRREPAVRMPDKGIGAVERSRPLGLPATRRTGAPRSLRARARSAPRCSPDAGAAGRFAAEARPSAGPIWRLRAGAVFWAFFGISGSFWRTLNGP